MPQKFFKIILLILGLIIISFSFISIFLIFNISQKEFNNKTKIFLFKNYLFSLQKKIDLDWQISNFTDVKDDLNYFFAKLDSYDVNNKILVVNTYDKNQVKIKLTEDYISTLIFKIPLGKNYLSLFRVNEKWENLRKNELICILGRKASSNLSEKEQMEGINFYALEVVKRK